MVNRIHTDGRMSCVRQWSGRPGFNPRTSHTKKKKEKKKKTT